MLADRVARALNRLGIHYAWVMAADENDESVAAHVAVHIDGYYFDAQGVLNKSALKCYWAGRAPGVAMYGREVSVHHEESIKKLVKATRRYGGEFESDEPARVAEIVGRLTGMPGIESAAKTFQPPEGRAMVATIIPRVSIESTSDVRETPVERAVAAPSAAPADSRTSDGQAYLYVLTDLDAGAHQYKCAGVATEVGAAPEIAGSIALVEFASRGSLVLPAFCGDEIDHDDAIARGAARALDRAAGIISGRIVSGLATPEEHAVFDRAADEASAEHEALEMARRGGEFPRGEFAF